MLLLCNLLLCYFLFPQQHPIHQAGSPFIILKYHKIPALSTALYFFNKEKEYLSYSFSLWHFFCTYFKRVNKEGTQKNFFKFTVFPVSLLLAIFHLHDEFSIWILHLMNHKCDFRFYQNLHTNI